MRHRKLRLKLSRTQDERRALLRNLAHALIIHERIETTHIKAKALQRYVEKLITHARNGTQASRRLVFAKLARKEAVDRLFKDIAPLFKDRSGGYTRIIPLGPRRGDGTEMALIELVNRTQAYQDKQDEKAARRERKKEKQMKRAVPKI
ncbi:MAG: 50S ribosomal protein L17 [Candidatus Sumerlaeia bacterium]